MNVRIVSDASPGGTHVFVDGVEMKGIRKVSWNIAVDRGGTATIELFPVSIDVVGEVVPE